MRRLLHLFTLRSKSLRLHLPVLTLTSGTKRCRHISMHAPTQRALREKQRSKRPETTSSRTWSRRSSCHVCASLQ